MKAIGFLSLAVLASPVLADSTIDSGNKVAYSANTGWIDWKWSTSPAEGAVVSEHVLSGKIYSANFGWIELGDGTPEAVKPLLDKEIEGFGEMFRVLSYQTIKSSTLQSRALSGVANSTYLFVLPGSSGACADAWDNIISAQLDNRTMPCNLVMLMPRLNEK